MHISETTCPSFAKFYLLATYVRGSVFLPSTALRYVMYFRMSMTRVVFAVIQLERGGILHNRPTTNLLPLNFFLPKIGQDLTELLMTP